ILEHGKVAPKPYPDFYWDLVKNLLPKYEAPNEREPMRESLSGLLEAEGNDLLYQSPPGPIIVQPVIHDQDIETSLDNSNLVGNVYYATYYLWQGQTRDKFLHNIDPTLFHGTGVQGESLCLESHVFHLREAMPFDKIACTMHLKKLNKYSAEFTFEYFRREPDGSRIKIAVGDQVALWVTRDAEGNPIPSPFPAKVQAVFNAAIAKAKK
ncbi:MAG: hypothetical protein GY859_19395, partial [Desulfobacterales bacterium]|nr:hypothetical protein [Desulfobacterales bacterium]